MKFKPVANAPSDVPLQAPFAHGFAIIAQTTPSDLPRVSWTPLIGASCTTEVIYGNKKTL